MNSFHAKARTPSRKNFPLFAPLFAFRQRTRIRWGMRLREDGGAARVVTRGSTIDDAELLDRNCHPGPGEGHHPVHGPPSTASCCCPGRASASRTASTRPPRPRGCRAGRWSARRSRRRTSAASRASSASAPSSARRACCCRSSRSPSACSSTSCRPAPPTSRRRSTPCSSNAASASTPCRQAPGSWRPATAPRTARWCGRLSSALVNRVIVLQVRVDVGEWLAWARGAAPPRGGRRVHRGAPRSPAAAGAGPSRRRSPRRAPGRRWPGPSTWPRPRDSSRRRSAWPWPPAGSAPTTPRRSASLPKGSSRRRRRPAASPSASAQAKTLIQCLAGEQSLLLQSPPGVGKSAIVCRGGGRGGAAVPFAAGHADRAGGRQRHPAHRRRALGLLPAARAAARRARAVLPVPRRAAGLQRRTCRRRSTRCCWNAGWASTPCRRAPGSWPPATAPRTGPWSATSAPPWSTACSSCRSASMPTNGSAGPSGRACARRCCRSCGYMPEALMRPVPAGAGAVLDAPRLGHARRGPRPGGSAAAS